MKNIMENIDGTNLYFDKDCGTSRVSVEVCEETLRTINGIANELIDDLTQITNLKGKLSEMAYTDIKQELTLNSVIELLKELYSHGTPRMVQFYPFFGIDYATNQKSPTLILKVEVKVKDDSVLLHEKEAKEEMKDAD